MKRVWFAAALIVILIAGSVTVSVTVRRYAENAISIAEMAENAALQQNLAAARSLCKIGQQYWEEQDTFFSYFLRHDMTEGVLSAFAKLGAYAETEDADEFLALCRELRLQLEHIRDIEKPTLKNIF